MSINIEQARFARRVQEALGLAAEAAGDLATALENAVGVASTNEDTTRVATPVPQARGPRQQEIVNVLGQVNTERGLKTAEIADHVNMDQPNAYLTLQALQKQGLVEMMPGVKPQHWRLAPAYRLSRRIIQVASLVAEGEWTSYGDISQVVYGHAKAGPAVARVMATSPDVEHTHRVIPFTGEIPAGWKDGDLGPEECARRLRSEGVDVDEQLFAHGRHHVEHEELAKRLSQGPEALGHS